VCSSDLPNKLFIFSDQQLRGYSQTFYGTEEGLFQAELRYPLTADRKFNLAFFTDYGVQKIRGAQPLLDQFGNVVANYNDWYYYGDVGAGIRFDLPQLGFRSIRLDFARGLNEFHTSFGLGQSF
jgi:outer membrane protein assembly factor BamA